MEEFTWQQRRSNITVDLVLAHRNVHDLSYLHGLVQRKLADGTEVVGFTIVDVKDLDAPEKKP